MQSCRQRVTECWRRRVVCRVACKPPLATSGRKCDASPMLTHDDMDQLRGVIREEVEAEGKAVRREIAITNTQTKADFARITDRLKSLEIETAKTRESVVVIDHKLDQAQEDIAAILTTVIEHHSALEQRVTRIEERLRS